MGLALETSRHTWIRIALHRVGISWRLRKTKFILIECMDYQQSGTDMVFTVNKMKLNRALR